MALGWAALLFLFGPANTAAAQAQTSNRDRLPSELWRTYPLEPRKAEALIRSGNEPDQPQASRPGSGNAPAARDAGRAEEQPSANQDRPAAWPALSLFVLSLVGLIVVVLVARPAVAVGRHVPGSLARFGSAITSPVRSIAAPARPKLAGSALRAAASRTTQRSHRGTAVRLRAIGRTGGRAVRLPVRVGAAVGAALRSASLRIASKSGEILLYAVVVVASVAVGIALTFFVSGG